MKKLIILSCVLLALLASTAHSDSLLKKLKRELAKAKDQSEVTYVSASEVVNPIVLTVDGIDLSDKDIRRESSYLKPVVESWAISSDVTFVGWSGDYVRTESELAALEDKIASVYKRAKSEGRPFVMVTHSWGTVLSYRALKNLYAEGRLPENGVHAFVTMGSPLSKAGDPNSEGKTQAVGPSFVLPTITTIAVKEYGDWTGPEALDNVVRTWRNYWIKRDQISGPIPNATANPATWYIGFNAHKAYYTSPSISSRIREKLIADLNTFVTPLATVASTDVTMARGTGESSASTVRNSAFCLSGICLRERPQELSNKARGYNFSRSDINFGAVRDRIIGLSNQQFDELEKLSRQQTPPLDRVLSLLGDIEVMCLPWQINLSSSDVALPRIQLGIVLATPDGWQGLQVVRISRNYVVPIEKENEFKQQVNDRYPLNQSAKNEGYAVTLQSTALGRSTVPMTLELGYVGPLAHNVRSANRRDNPFQKHSKCPKPEMPSID